MHADGSSVEYDLHLTRTRGPIEHHVVYITERARAPSVKMSFQFYDSRLDVCRDPTWRYCLRGELVAELRPRSEAVSADFGGRRISGLQGMQVSSISKVIDEL